MSVLAEPTPSEPVIVQLTRMEGKLDRVGDRVNDLRGRVDVHEREIDALKSTAQTLTEGAVSSKETAVLLAQTLKDAKEATEAQARNEASKEAASTRERAAKDALGWSPIAKLLALAAGVLFAINIWQALTDTGTVP